jgi:hypothetical protein
MVFRFRRILCSRHRQGDDRALFRDAGRREVAMGYMDVAIPAVVGLVCVLAPRALTRNPAPAVIGRIRKIGCALLGVAVLYLTIKLSGH